MAADPGRDCSTWAFVENRGQWETEAAFVGRADGVTVRLEANRILVQLDAPPEPGGAGHLVAFSFEGASDASVLQPTDPRPGTHSFFQGKDPDTWLVGLREYDAVRYEDPYPGIDIVVHGRRGVLEYDLLLSEHAELADVSLRVGGVDELRLDEHGRLLAHTLLGPLVQEVPATWRVLEDGMLEPVECRYRLLDESTFGFEIPGRNASSRYVIDPTLEWATYLGSSTTGGGFDRPEAIAIDSDGFVTIAGRGAAGNFPATPGSFQSPGASGSSFITRLDPTGSQLVYSVVIGGPFLSDIVIFDLAVDAAGRAVVGGFVQTDDLPTTPGAYARSMTGGNDAFVLRLSSDGAALEYSTYLGGPNGESFSALALDTNGAVIVTGQATSGFPVTPGAFDVTPSPNGDVYVTRLSQDGSDLDWSTFLGGQLGQVPFDVAIDSTGAVTVVGVTNSSDFPTTPGAFDPIYSGFPPSSNVGFATRIAPDGSALEWSTFLEGGFGSTEAHAVALDPERGAVVTGFTFSQTFPVTPGALQKQWVGDQDVFVAYLDPTGSSLVYSTYFGGPGEDDATAIAVDRSGLVTIAGFTVGGLPTTRGSWQPLPKPFGEMYVARLSPAGDRLFYSSYVGTNSLDEFGDMAVRDAGQAVVAGRPFGAGFPTTPGAWNENYNGGQTDVLVAQLSMLPAGVERLGAPTPGGPAGPRSGVTAAPATGSSAFGVYATGAPPNVEGLLLLGTHALAAPRDFWGVGLWVDLDAPHRALPVSSDGRGYAEAPFALPKALAGSGLVTQFLFFGSEVPGERLSATDALSVQPLSALAVEALLQAMPAGR